MDRGVRQLNRGRKDLRLPTVSKDVDGNTANIAASRVTMDAAGLGAENCERRRADRNTDEVITVRSLKAGAPNIEGDGHMRLVKSFQIGAE